MIQNTLKENVDQVRKQIDDLYRKLQDNWDDVNDFNDEDLQALKTLMPIKRSGLLMLLKVLNIERMIY